MKVEISTDNFESQNWNFKMSEIRDLELKTHVSEFTVGTVEIDEKKLKRFFFLSTEQETIASQRQ